jgi:hypothetical protein
MGLPPPARVLINQATKLAKLRIIIVIREASNFVTFLLSHFFSINAKGRIILSICYEKFS